MITMTPTTHTPGGPPSRTPRQPAAGDEYRRAQLLIDRLRGQVDEAQSLLERQLPAGHLHGLVMALDGAKRSMEEPVTRVARWTRARNYPVRTRPDTRGVDRAEFSGGNG